MSRQNISILIVDDEPEARDLLSMLLERIGSVELTGTADIHHGYFALGVPRYYSDSSTKFVLECEGAVADDFLVGIAYVAE